MLEFKQHLNISNIWKWNQKTVPKDTEEEAYCLFMGNQKRYWIDQEYYKNFSYFLPDWFNIQLKYLNKLGM